MLSPSQALGWLVGGWLIAIAVLIGYRILTGRIALDGLLTINGAQFSLERFQLLLVTVGALGIYVGEALGAKTMPAVPDGVLPFLAGSHALYLGGKIAGR